MQTLLAAIVLVLVARPLFVRIDPSEARTHCERTVLKCCYHISMRGLSTELIAGHIDTSMSRILGLFYKLCYAHAGRPALYFVP